MDTTRCLREEHQVILKVLDCFDVALRQARQSGQTPRDTFAPFLEFFRDFADRCHHCKEEDRLFPCLEQCGMPRDSGPLAVMMDEHRQGRGHVRAMAAALDSAHAGDPHSIQSILAEGASFLDLLRSHIMKEDHFLFEMADQIVDSPGSAQLSGAYAQADSEQAAMLARCRRLAADLCARYGVPPPEEPAQP
jgi:hemerythrin-like domain-containing protein